MVVGPACPLAQFSLPQRPTMMVGVAREHSCASVTLADGAARGIAAAEAIESPSHLEVRRPKPNYRPRHREAERCVKGGCQYSFHACLFAVAHGHADNRGAGGMDNLLAGDNRSARFSRPCKPRDFPAIMRLL
jgi:hypothetical protein